jgi:methylenetetrahydrofolate dehydrogenase (NADP+)/methenyltetrahydrofolate cyclohydrolase
MQILDGKKVSNEIIENIKKEIIANDLHLTLAIIWVGNNEASSIYIKNKMKKCDYVGIKCELYHLDENTTENEVIILIDSLNKRNDVNGILLQSPVPSHINIINCFNRISPGKDIDGFSESSVASLYLNNPKMISCTPKGIIRLLDYYNIDIEGKNVCIINRSNIIGKPLFHLLLNRNATVTVCHSKTKDLDTFTKMADIVICAVGIPNFLTADMIKENAIVVGVGISRVGEKIVGDIDFDDVSKKASYITPTPGGVGPMTIAMILENIVSTIKED